jgi:hypothetical protein
MSGHSADAGKPLQNGMEGPWRLGGNSHRLGAAVRLVPWYMAAVVVESAECS